MKKEVKPANEIKKTIKPVRKSACPYDRRCGGCQYQDTPYKEQLKKKQKTVEKLLSPLCAVKPIAGMKDPLHYRNKVSAAFGRLRNGTYISGVYEENSHRIVPIEECLIEDQKADAIIGTIRGMLKSFKIHTYDEDTGYGLLRHVLVRVGRHSGQIMVVLVLASPILPSKNNFVKALRKEHPEITTIVINVNDKQTSMVLGNKETAIYGKGYIEDSLCDATFRISPKSFYQINPAQTEVLYKKALSLAELTGKERIVDAYCGIGTIGIIAAPHAKEVISVELNRDAVRDAVQNAKKNEIKNISFYQADAGKFMTQMAQQGEHVDVVLMDPPRAGSDEAFMASVVKLSPNRVVYISCNPETLARDLQYFDKHGYKAKEAWPVDMFPFCWDVETVCLLSKLRS
ncbi:MAG: 23S rRNA (uracil(1939)-C(5))-methyltransferase RlmD [Lachnospiraceae bacterium]|nr:23S rRNA (uracil(1939)-C(5))-methyltransferase RlmD [Lachnospiraceae bacterium]